MKHHRATRIALMSTLVAAFAAPVLAQQPTATINESVSTTTAAPRPDAPPPGPHAHRPGPGGAGGPGAHHGPRGEPMLHGVQLTQEQQAKVAALRDAAEPQLREAMQAGVTARQGLRELAAAATFDEARAQQLANDAAAAQAKAAVLRAKTEHQIYALLTPEQRITVDTKRKEHEARWEQRRAERQAREARGERPVRGERGERRAAPDAPPAPAVAPAPSAAPAAPVAPVAPPAAP